MAIQDARRLYMVMPYLYPDLKNENPTGDYHLQNDSDGKGTYVIWHNTEIPKPTDQELADAKEEAMNIYWWKLVRKVRDKLLVDSDWSQGADVPSDLKSSYVTYRNDLRDLPTTVTKPSFETLDGQDVAEWDIAGLMPNKP